MTPIDYGTAVHYTAVTPGTPVFGSDEVEAGKVMEVLDNYKEHIFDGLVIETADGALRFVDAPEVTRTAERAVMLSITAAEAADLPPPEKAPGIFSPRSGKVASRLFGGWKRH